MARITQTIQAKLGARRAGARAKMTRVARAAQAMRTAQMSRGTVATVAKAENVAGGGAKYTI